jgi:hypothetical protein
MEAQQITNPNILMGDDDLNPIKIAEEIRKRDLSNGVGEPYTRVEVMLENGKMKQSISIAVSREGVIHDVLEKENLLSGKRKIISIEFKGGVIPDVTK